MWGLICEPRPSTKRPLREPLQIVGLQRDGHRVARERDGDRGADLDPLGALGRDRTGDEGVDLGLDRPPAVVAAALCLECRGAGLVDRRGM